MYKDTGCKSAFEWHSRCLETNLGSIVDCLIDFEDFVDTFVPEETQSALRNTLFLYIADAHERVACCQNLFDVLMKDRVEVTNET